MAKNNNLGDFLKSLADKFRLKLDTTAKINPQDFESKIDEVGESGYNDGWLSGWGEGNAQGKQEAYDTFWDNYQSNGNRTIYEYAFAREGWTNATFKPKYNITVDLNNSPNMFSYSKIEGSLKTILNQNGVSLTFHNSDNTNGPRYMFVGTKFTELPELDFSEAKGNAALASTFSGSTLIQRIEKIILPNNCTGYGTNTFYYCNALENLTIEGTIKYSLNFSACPISADSVYSILNHLDTEGYTGTRTITLKTTSKNAYQEKYSNWDEKIAQLTSSGNWTFTLT